MKIKGAIVNDNEKDVVTLSGEMYEDFRKCCVQEGYEHDVISEEPDNIKCRADQKMIDFFIGCMKSEHEETIKKLCSLSKSTLNDRMNRIPFEEESEKWINEVDIDLVKEALLRYDEPEFVEERLEMMKALLTENMSNNKKHFYGQNSTLDQKIITDRSRLKFPCDFMFGKSGGSGKIVDGKVIKYKVPKPSLIK